ncbi:MAG TPA: hypothetical protein ENK85_08670 [Saprospiraceae bacterium]|nr:hypothetical protein [Saprospiraceae bacterium]
MEKFTTLTDAFSEKFGNSLPTVLGALLVLILGFILAKIVKGIVLRLMRKTSIDEKLEARLHTPFRLDKFVAKLVYYLVIVFTLLVVLNMMGANSVLQPLQTMLNRFTGFLPNILGAGIIGFAGYMIASIVSEMTGFLSERLEAWGGRIGMSTGSMNLSKLVKQIVFIFVFVPIFILALDTLKMDAISKPATEMLSTFMAAIPKIIAAVIILGVFYVVGKLIVNFLVDLLHNLGIDNYATTMGLQSVLGNSSLSVLLGKVAMFFIMFTGVIAAIDKLDLGQVETILNDIFVISGRVFFGLIILIGGLAISRIATKMVEQSSNGAFFVPIVRFAIMGIFLAFALNTMGIAESIVNLAFGLTLGAIAVAFALSFGLGGREAAGKQMESFFDNLRKKK